MSQPQVQQRPVATNGVGNRRGRVDRDVSNSRADAGLRSDSQNWRSSSQALQRSNSATGTAPGSSHGLVHFNSMGINNNPNAINRHGERPDGTAPFINRNAGDRMDSVVREGPLHQRLLYMAMSLIGQHVEVQVKNGSFYSGIFHTANVEKDFGIVLKMARLIQDGSGKGAKSEAVKEAARRAPQRTLIIQGKDFVQMIAKDVSLSDYAMPNGRARENRTDIDTDATLSQNRHRDMERELKPWKPDDEPPRSLGLDSTFRNWNRNWDQFEANKALFGVETTFNEELYTTKLERGPQMREREREASRIAREIEGTTTKNLHLAEERGIRLTPEFEEMDEESRFSSVIRRTERLDVGEDGEDRRIDDHNDETFGSSFTGAGSLASPTDSSVSTALTGETESKASRPSSADSTQTADGPLQRDPSLSLQERRASSLDKGDVAGLDSHSDAHREHLRLRHRLVGDKGRRSCKAGGSPYHSPVGRGSPHISPLVGDASVTHLDALNLDPSSPQLPEEVYRDFHEFKKETAKQGKRQQREDQVNELKLFSESLKKKELEPRSPRSAAKPVAGEHASSGRHVSHEGVGRPLPLGDNKEIPSSSASTGHLTTAQASAPPASALPIPIALGGQSSGGSSIAGNLVPRKSSDASTGEGSFDASNGNPVVVSSVSTGLVCAAGHNGLPVLSSISTKYSAPAPAVPIVHVSHPPSPTASPSSSVSSAASGAPFGSKKSTLNPNAKEFKLNPNAKSFTPTFSSQGSATPVIPAPVYMQGLPPVPQMPGVQVGISVAPYVQQLSQPPQFPQYNNAMAATSSPQYMQPQGGYVPPNAGVPPVLPGQHGMKMQQHSPQQVVGPPYQQQQQLRYPAQGQAVQPQPAYMHPNGQLYPQQMMYGQQQVVYMYPQGQPVHPPPQGPLPPQPSPQTQQQKHRNGGGMQQIHYTGGAPSFFPQPPLPSHLHNSLQPSPGGLPPVSIPGVQPPQTMVPSSGNGGSGNAVRIGGGKSGAGSFQQ